MSLLHVVKLIFFSFSLFHCIYVVMYTCYRISVNKDFYLRRDAQAGPIRQGVSETVDRNEIVFVTRVNVLTF